MKMKKIYISRRTVITILACIYLFLSEMARLCFKCVITDAQISNDRIYNKNIALCPADPPVEYDIPKMEPVISNNLMVAYRMILYICVYSLAVLPIGLLCDRFGPRKLIITSSVLQAVNNIVDASLADTLSWEYQLLLAAFTVPGFAVPYPAVTSLMASWFPLRQRTLAAAVFYSGTMVADFYSEFIIHVLMLIHWKAPFYIISSVNLVFAAIFVFHGYSTPKQDPHITQEELDLLIGTVGIKEHMKPPIWKMLRSGSVWALMLANMGIDFNEHLLTNVLPVYFNAVLQLDTRENVFETYLSGILVVSQNILVGYLSDYFIFNKEFQIIYVRCWVMSVSIGLSSCLAIIPGYVKCAKIWSFTVYVMALNLRTSVYCSVYINPVDIAFNNPATVMGLMHTCGLLFGELFCHLFYFYLRITDFATWQLALWMSFLINLTSGFLFCVLSKGTRQDWDYVDEHEIDVRKSLKRVRSEFE